MRFSDIELNHIVLGAKEMELHSCDVCILLYKLLVVNVVSFVLLL